MSANEAMARLSQVMSVRQLVILGTTIAAAVIIISILFVRPLIGMADNGDFFREIHNMGLYYLTDNFDDRHFSYFNKDFGIRQYPYDQNTLFISSLSLLIRMGLTLDLWFTPDNLFDIRMLAVIYVIVFLAAFYMLLKQASEYLKLPILILACMAGISVFGDVGYVAYFNSFYGEPASYVFLLLMLALVFRMLQKQTPSIPDFILFMVSATLFISAKQQNAPMGVFLVFLCVRFMFLRQDKRWKIAVITLTACLVASAALIYGSMTDDIKHINQYHAVTRGILENSTNPERDLEELGLDPKFSILAGTTYYDQYVMEHTESKLLNEEFYSKYGYGTIIKYYVLHPDRAFEKLDLAAKHAYAIRPEVIGNYEKSAGLSPGQKTTIFSLWSSVKLFIFPENFRFILLFYAVYYGGLTKLYITRFRKGEARGMMGLEVLASIGLIGLSQLAVSFLGAGDADLAKHLFLFNVSFDLMFVAMLVYGLNQLYVKLDIAQKVGVFRWKQKRSISG
ncbi:glycan biosynthesis hexose transferase WsfD [Paenibacillus sp. y28]|uniref:glycan biosynthesis hexose transferase WsfD n=1 Tax=Paenibacillus sp. y28 TaxID=3129110 RepID=UPI0030167D18